MAEQAPLGIQVIRGDTPTERLLVEVKWLFSSAKLFKRIRLQAEREEKPFQKLLQRTRNAPEWPAGSQLAYKGIDISGAKKVPIWSIA